MSYLLRGFDGKIHLGEEGFFVFLKKESIHGMGRRSGQQFEMKREECKERTKIKNDGGRRQPQVPQGRPSLSEEERRSTKGFGWREVKDKHFL